MTTTLGAITPGEAMLGDENDACASVQLDNGNRIYFDRIDPMSGKRVNTREEMLANVDLVINTFNTANKTGKLPSQLLQERDELAGALRELLGKNWHSDQCKGLDEFRGFKANGACTCGYAYEVEYYTALLSKYNPKP